MNPREIRRRNRLLAEAARSAGGYHNLAQRIAEKRSAETRKKYQPVESWHGGDYSYRETSSSDSTSCSGSSTKGTMAVVQNGKLTSLDRVGAPDVFMRFNLSPSRMREIFPTQVQAQNPKQLTVILSRLIAADAYAHLGATAETDLRICAIWIDPNDWAATIIVATTERSKAKWRTSKCGSQAQTVAGHPIVPYTSILTLEDKIQPIYKMEMIIQASQKAPPRRRYSKLWSLPFLLAEIAK